MSFTKFPTSIAEGRKSDDGIDSLNTLVRKSLGRDPFLSFPRSTESPIQWLQLLHGLDPDSAGWPLLPVNVPMQKCGKCNGEYYSPINYRRHMRVHHRLKRLEKDDLKNRELLRLFWDKLSADEAKEIVSLKNTTLEGLPGATVVKELASLTRKPGIPSLPHFCIKAGSALLDIVQARPSRFPPSSQELFGVLDDASERTFLCGSAISMQKYIFDGEAAKIGLDAKNLVAFTSFLLEQRLVEAWISDKDAEALRCQKLLVEEEEAAKRRQAEISERKRRKKMRQKEQKVKEQKNEEEGGFSVEESEPLADTSFDLLSALDSESNDNLDQAASSTEIHNVEDADPESHQAEMESVRDDDSNIHPRNEPRRINHNPRPFWQQNPSFVTNVSRGSSTWKHEFRNWHGPHTLNKKVWSRKVKLENGEDSLKVVREQQETLLVQAEQDPRQEVLIGSIAVSLGSTEVRDDSDASGGRGLSSDHTLQKGHEVRDNITLKSGDGEASVTPNDNNCSSESCVEPRCSVYHHNNSDIDSVSKESRFPFSGAAARAFLAQRWKEAIASDHVTLLLSPPPNRPFLERRDRPASIGRSTLNVSESQVGRGGSIGLKKYIAKQKDGT